MKLLETLKRNERGNALFLILIAVALFAALSYAVTQSGRGGGGIDREQALIGASQVTQYAAGLRTTATRMLITGTQLADLNFGTSADSDDVFDSDGGGAIEQEPPSGVSATTTSYVYMDATDNSNPDLGWYITGIGTDTAETGRDVILGVASLTLNVCQEINRGLGLAITPLQEDTAVTMGVAGAGPAGDTAFTFHSHNADPQAFACVDNDPAAAPAVDYTYYHALVEN